MKKNIYNNSKTLISDEIPAQSQGRAVSFYVDGFNLYHHIQKFLKKSKKILKIIMLDIFFLFFMMSKHFQFKK